VGARCAHHWPFWHHFVPFWQENEPELRPIEGVGNVGGKRWAKMSVYFCPSLAHFSAAELPTWMPKSARDMRGMFTHVQARRGQNLGLCARNGVHCSMFTFCFSKISFHPLHQFDSKGTIATRKKSSYPMVCSGQEKVQWLQNCAFTTLLATVA